MVMVLLGLLLIAADPPPAQTSPKPRPKVISAAMFARPAAASPSRSGRKKMPTGNASQSRFG